jgi:glucose/arabinose dehydrogenase
MSGWLPSTGSGQGQGALGRPVDLKFDAQGALFISDDKAGVIYKVEYAH